MSEEIERYLLPHQLGAIYQVKFPEFKQYYTFQTELWSDISFHFNEASPEKSFFKKESVRVPIPIQNCEFREMKDMSGNPILILGSEKVTDMPYIFVGMANIPLDAHCRQMILAEEIKKGEESTAVN